MPTCSEGKSVAQINNQCRLDFIFKSSEIAAAIPNDTQGY
jgi:hypothetical protein